MRDRQVHLSSNFCGKRVKFFIQLAYLHSINKLYFVIVLNSEINNLIIIKRQFNLQAD